MIRRGTLSLLLFAIAFPARRLAHVGFRRTGTATQKIPRFFVCATAVVMFIFFISWMSWVPRSRATRQKISKLAQPPLSFEVNRGQANAEAKYLARGGGYALLLTNRGEPVLALHRRPAQWQANPVGELPAAAERALLRLAFPGGNPSPQAEGEQPLPGRSNYLIGNDPSQWLTGVPHFAGVRYREVYRGVDVLYYTRDQQLEYDFIVRPGSIPESIRMIVQGAMEIERSELGSLVVKTAAGPVRMHRPVAYQQGPDGEREVACNYVLEKGEVRFALGDYDRSQVLRIDPVLSYSAPQDALIKAIAVDASGNSYLAGSTSSANFPTTPGAFQPSRGGAADAVIAKLDPTGSTLLFATYLGGSADDSADSIALDSSGNVIVAGRTGSTNLPVNNAFQAALSGNEDAFLSKLNATGTQLLYSTYLGGSGTDSVRGVVLDASGRALLTGSTDSSNFPTSTGAFQAASGGNGDAFIAKVDATQSGVTSLLFSTYLGGDNQDAAGGIAADATGNVFVTGLTLSSNFPTASPLQASCASCASGMADAFVTKLNVTGSALVYSTFLGGNDRDAGDGIALDSMGNAHIAGTTVSFNNFPTTVGAFQTSPHGVADAFVSKLNAAGSALLYSSFVGGDYYDGATGIALDSSGNAYLTGFSLSADFPTVNPLQGPSGGDCDFVLFPDVCSDAVVLQMNADGSALTYSTYLGMAGTNESGTGIAVDAAGNAFVAGIAGVSSFTDLLSLFGPLYSGTGFVAKISPGTQQVASISLMAAQTSATVSRGGTATFPLTVFQAGVLTSDIAFSCSGLPVGWNCEFNPMTVQAGSDPTQVTLTLQVGSTAAQNLSRAPIVGPGLRGNIWPGVLALLMLGIHLGARGHKAYLRPGVALGFAVLLLLSVGCGSGSGSGSGETPQSVTVNFTVGATSGSTTTSIPFTVTVR